MGEDAPDRPALAAREKALLDEHAKRWAAPLEGLIYEPRFRRGFVESAEVGGETPFAKELTRAVALAPIRSLTISAQFVNGRHLHAAAPAMARLRRLQFSYPNFTPGANKAETFFGRPELRRLTALFVMGDRNGSGSTGEIAHAIVASPALANLTELTLIQDFRGLSCSVIRELAGSPQMGRLERLSLEQSRIDAETMRALSNSLHLKGLKELELGDCGLDEAGWEALLTSPRFASLSRMHLANAPVYGPHGGIAAYVGKPRFDNPPPPAVEAFRPQLLSRFGPEVLDFESDSYCRWRE